MENLEKLKELFRVLDRISDMCYDAPALYHKEIIDEVGSLASGELAELEELIIKLESNKK